MSTTTARTALVTGANRGIGLEVARQLARRGLGVVLTARDAALGEQAAEKLQAEGLQATFELLDVASERSVRDCAGRLARESVHVDVLVNNAGVYPGRALLDSTPAEFQEAFEVNFLGAVFTCQAFVPAMVEAGYGRVVNVSSGSGSLAEGLEGPAPYALSKAALNALSLRLASEVRGDVKVNAVCPGWVRTRMGGEDATRSVEHGAETIVWLATLGPDGPTGGFFRDRERIAW